MIRGDEDLLTIMDEMTPSVQISSENSSQNKKVDDAEDQTEAKITSNTHTTGIRLTPEVDGYGNEEESIHLVKNGPAGDIWNPYISVSKFTSPLQTSESKILICMAPTNPDVEILRRRAYEKFKSKFYTSFRWIVGNRPSDTLQSKKKKEGLDSNQENEMLKIIWRYLPPHNILERLHFASKLEESIRIMNRDRTSSQFNSSANINLTIRDITSMLLNGRETGKLMDPILLSTLKNQNNKKKNKLGKNEEIQQISNFNLIRHEIQFQFLREWKKSYKNNSNQDTITEFFATAGFKRKCTKICQEIQNISLDVDRDFFTELSKKATEIGRTSSSAHSNKKRKGIPKVSKQIQDDKSKPSNDQKEFMSVVYSGLSFRISIPHFKKLQILFDRNNSDSTGLMQHRDSFYRALFSILCRYDMLEGGGLQSALNGHVFDVLLKCFNCDTECFASPFNCRYERFFSAFPDTDMTFGSLGSFFEYDFQALSQGGCFQANPPFANDFILAMYTRMELLLGNKSVIAPFMFIIFIPAWIESTGWQTISKSSLLTKSVLLSQKDDPHYYCEGTQHRRLKERYRLASFDTSIFFLQNDAAKMKWPVTDTCINELKDAFASNPDEYDINIKKNQNSIKVVRKENEAQVERFAKVNIEKKDNKITKQKNKRSSDPGHKKNNVAKKKKLVDDSSSNRQLEILSSIGILDKSDKRATDSKAPGNVKDSYVGSKKQKKRRHK